MIRKTLSTCLVLLSLFAWAQDEVPTKIGSDIKYRKKPVHFLAGEKDGKIYAVGVKGATLSLIPKNKDVQLQVYDGQTLEPLKTYTIERFKYEGNKTKLIEVIPNDAGIHLLYKVIDRKEDKLLLIHQKLSRLGVAEAPRKIADVEGLSRFGTEFLFYNSEDNKTTMVYEEAHINREVVQTPEVSLFDENFEPIWSGMVSSPFPDRMFAPVQMEVSQRGELFILGFAKEEEQLMRKAKKTEAYGIVRVFKNEPPKTYSFEDKGKVFHSMAIHPDYQGKLLVSGFYANGEGQPVTGSVFGMMDPSSLSEDKMLLKTFDEGVFGYFHQSSKFKEQSQLREIFNPTFHPAFEGLDYMRYKDFVSHPKGGVVVVAERQYASRDLQELTSVNEIRQFYDEMALFYFNDEGDLQWLSIVPKSQIVSSSAKASYFLHEAEDGIKLLFNDQPGNLERRAEGETIERVEEGKTWFGLQTVCASIDWEGNVSYAALGGSEGASNSFILDFLLSAGKESVIAIVLKRIGAKYWLERYQFGEEPL